ncbi:amino acid ABC transporter substrate-binding protein [Methylocystis sp. MJC1]|jgi:general L-amino acid transport system substrate-binding protein|uniref:amino acid ABC transporter substrate-binding protein n=1 Tax=Methylocystis sp. MJC1 TaxID=2654282 RepID=UPI0013EAB3EB|nr:amino acid ABC transporter substrate-binding protein [Methylocystis sp. MJC1]KAF2992152.1 putative amino-acid ABC transporter-binding protein YhdW [Methylocystis sp. MJC1]MBU6527293.1 amino acid ABC transporter substrate-binding protein [Methylocystis sp. MJC1]UZX10247.1 amino acid ABC transporter substrate-binding protein [Methylocystis sp. MJC1]
MIARRFLLAVATAIVLAGLLPTLLGQGASAQTDAGPTLATVIKRGYLSCGVVESPGFAQPSGENGEWRGFDVDFCRAVAAAIFDDPTKVRFLGLSAKERVPALQAGWVDLLASAAPWTQTRDGGQRVIYAGVSLFDGQSFLVRRQRSFASAQDLAEVAVCVQQGTSYELELADFFHKRKTSYQPKLFATFEEAAAGYDKSECEALTADAATLYAARTKLATPAEHDVLPDLLTKAPRGPVVRQGDDQWLSIVRWTLFLMIDAEEQRVSKANADAALKSEEPRIRHLLGVEGDRGVGLALPGDWPYRIVKHVGNYADVFERNLGQSSPLNMERRLNALWNKGGLLYAPAVR